MKKRVIAGGLLVAALCLVMSGCSGGSSGGGSYGGASSGTETPSYGARATGKATGAGGTTGDAGAPKEQDDLDASSW